MKRIADLKKGDKVLLNYGSQFGDLATCGTFKKWLMLEVNGSSYKSFTGIVMEKPRSKDPVSVMLDVDSEFGHDMGSVYSAQIIGWLNPETGVYDPIEHTQKQIDIEKQSREMFG